MNRPYMKLRVDRARPVVIQFTNQHGNLVQVEAWYYFPSSQGLQCSLHIISGSHWTRKNSYGHAIFDLLRAVVPRLHTQWTCSGKIPSVISITTNLLTTAQSIADLPPSMCVGTYCEDELRKHGVEDAMQLIHDPAAVNRSAMHTIPMVMARPAELDN